jgi:DNA primase
VPSVEQRNSLAELVAKYHDQIRDSGAETYLTDRGINRRAIEKFQLGYTGDTGDRVTSDRLAIPYLTPAGPWQIKYRCLGGHDGSCKDNRHGKYVYDDGAQQMLFNAQTLLTTDRVVVVEGELDAVSVEMAGAPCVAFPGADTWKKNRHWRWCFDSLDEVIFVADGDDPAKNPRDNGMGVGEEAARQAADTLRNSLPDLDVQVCVMPPGHDSNSYIVENGSLDYLEQIGWFG